MYMVHIMHIHSLNVYIHVCTYLWCLTRGVIRVSPQHNFADLMQNAVCLFKIPLGLLPCLIREVFLKEVKKINCFLLQLGQLCLWNACLARRDVPIHALNEYLYNLVTGISNMRQFVRT